MADALTLCLESLQQSDGFFLLGVRVTICGSKQRFAPPNPPSTRQVLDSYGWSNDIRVTTMQYEPNNILKKFLRKTERRSR
jgi:hypothetical protein